ncbi:FadR/GntR family transcriptional regulator [Pseudomonas sp. FME51]|uniref:FadR/GntR family transcriptional regulator n=1 Tax=Pseudomonas sp. FME51 TaxID=2742609 RepID=UPI001865F794|nr:FadR/GntR family transcriptional regulator [Pseudomonas sp. FME51]
MDTQNVQPRARRKHRSLAQELVTELSQQIRDGIIKRGDKLPTESAIMEVQGVSRTVVREALSRLQASGLVETRHGIGTFVLDVPSPSGFRIDPATIVTLRDVLAIIELRISLEVESAGLAAQRRSSEQLAAMRAALDTLGDSASLSGDAVASDFQFHLMIAESTGNRYFTDIMSHLGTSIIPRTRLNSAHIADDDQQHYLARLRREHEQIFEAIARQDPDEARAAMRLHLTSSRERLRQAHESAEAESQCAVSTPRKRRKAGAPRLE